MIYTGYKFGHHFAFNYPSTWSEHKHAQCWLKIWYTYFVSSFSFLQLYSATLLSIQNCRRIPAKSHNTLSVIHGVLLYPFPAQLCLNRVMFSTSFHPHPPYNIDTSRVYMRDTNLVIICLQLSPYLVRTSAGTVLTKIWYTYFASSFSVLQLYSATLLSMQNCRRLPAKSRNTLSVKSCCTITLLLVIGT